MKVAQADAAFPLAGDDADAHAVAESVHVCQVAHAVSAGPG